MCGIGSNICTSFGFAFPAKENCHSALKVQGHSALKVQGHSALKVQGHSALKVQLTWIKLYMKYSLTMLETAAVEAGLKGVVER